MTLRLRLTGSAATRSGTTKARFGGGAANERMALKHPSETAADAPPPAMSRSERRAVAALSGIFSLRMLGLFMFLPVFSVHAHEYAGHTPLLIGVAIGIYGLTQGVFQVPFGVLSDRFGRKPAIAAGLVIFALGSVVAALADGIWGIVAGRALQGLGAVAAAVMALAGDLTGEAHRTKAMACIGVSIGAAFALALVLGPALTGVAGVSGLFWTTAILAAIAVALLYLGVPDPPRMANAGGAPLAGLAVALRDRQMRRLHAGIFILHAVMIATFVALPIMLRDRAGINATDHWKVYVGVLLASVVFTAPLVVLADRKNRSRAVMLLGIVLLGAALAGLAAAAAPAVAGTGAGSVVLIACMVVYFTGFNTLEASLPAMVSRAAPMRARGAALGVYSTSQYLGAFAGGVIGGWLLGAGGERAVLAACAGLCAGWMLIAAGLRQPRPLSVEQLRIGAVEREAVDALTARLLAVPGVVEAVVVAEERTAWLRVDRRRLDRPALRAISPTNS